MGAGYSEIVTLSGACSRMSRAALLDADFIKYGALANGWFDSVFPTVYRIISL
jgi:hypothetical protein